MYHKTEEFDPALREVAAIAKALSHPARLAILRHLAEQKSCYSGNIADELPLSRTTVSQHLQELKRCGLIQGEIEGTRNCYCINTEVFERSRAAVTAFLAGINEREAAHPAGSCAVPGDERQTKASIRNKTSLQ